MNRNDEKLLEENGWIVECESPFEISNDAGNFASGEGAILILADLKNDDSEIVCGYTEQDMRECFIAGTNRGVELAAKVMKNNFDEKYPNYQDYMKKFEEDE